MARKPLRPLIRSGGFYPSRKWTPLVYAGGYTTANGGEEPAPPPIEKTVTGNPIHILDALAKPAQALSVKLEPIQDLNGYDNPWPSGGGKNKFFPPDAPITIDGVTVEGTSDGEIWVHGTPAFASGYKSFNFGTLPESLEGETVSLSISEKIAGFGIVIGSNNGNLNLTMSDTVASKSGVYTAGGTRACYINIRYDVGTIDKKFKIQLEVNATPTAWTPYSNICPISGHTDADVTRTGVNVWDEEWEVGGISSTTGQNMPNIVQIRSKNYIPIKPNTTYFGFALNQPANENFQSRFYDKDKNFIGTGTGSLWMYNTTYTSPSNACYLRFCMQGSYGTTYNHDISINYPSTDTSYHAYTGTTYPIPLGQTVYGGTLDVLTGVLTVTKRYMSFSSGVVPYGNWGHDNAPLFYLNIPSGDVITTSDVASKPPLQSNYFKFIAASYVEAMGNCEMRTNAGASASRIYFRWDEAVDATTVNAAFAVTPLQVVADLAEPFEITLTPTQVELLLGENNIWSDGEMTLVYLADGNASDVEALNILLGGRYVNNHGEDEPTDREALDILLGR